MGVLVLLALGGPVPVCSAQAPPSAVPDLVSAVDAARLYADACAACHGARGDGRGPAARGLGLPRPRDFTAGVFKFRTTPSGSLPSDQDLFRTISQGVAGTWMPAWGTRLTEAECWALVRYIKSFAPTFRTEAPDPPVPLPSPPGRSRELISEGPWVYAVLGCAQCHGERGRGNGPSARRLSDDYGDPIRPYDFTRGAYKNGGSPEALYRTLRTGLSGTPMPALEPSVLAYAGGANADVAGLRRRLPPAEFDGAATYLTREPNAAELAAMSPAALDALVERRLWALVYYIQSLERRASLPYRLLREDAEAAVGAARTAAGKP